ncbi:DUF924 family protein [Pseudaquabacterium pictum]|uniref:DUF924 domain-containing protein n=1 Tax=Pseudaquabacterium pictum TaxID=2315236 RepID=A0A480AJ90_9BURK|nr:DUF924 family protein [Rubrivivax pictus]GCL61714.1 hypothetical protein AQPW35_07950 [Rubrivivax pictus]
MHTDALAVLDFWFGPPDDPGHAQPRPQWFTKDDAFDDQIRQRFGPLIERALVGDIDDWLTRPVDPLPALARVIVLDQFTRNTFRGTARAFAGDDMALQTARALVASGADRALTGVQRQFAYLPFEHAEDLSHQRTAVQLFQQLAADEPARAELVVWAQKHLDIVARFGRFPHRNAALGRASTAEEAAFLLTPGSGF